ncbi:MAG TPA: zinc-dependent alcohol dehydrogenase family protein [Candidatus Saccharimonadaceae bacterium]|nr:zinc-dependent alcohol dehydrogenase family protein [Candidatus Saccharimonadaceae bacterium]
MKATIFKGKGDVQIGERPDPEIQEPTDAIVRVVMGCVCGSDLWYYRGINPHKHGSIGHEFIGVVDRIGESVKDLAKGDLVIAPFTYSDGMCANCRAGFQSQCVHGGGFGNGESDGGQGEYVRVPYADATLVKVPAGEYSEDMLASFLGLSDVISTGYHAAVSAEVKAGDTVAVVGDGAVGLGGIIGAKLLGAERIIALSRNPSRQKLAREFGATDIVEARGDEAVEAVMKLTDGVGVNAALECVGTDQSIATCAGITRPGGMIGAVGVPNYQDFKYQTIFWKNVGIRGGVAPARQYIPTLLPAVLDGRINPGKVFDFRTELANIKEAYVAMDERRAVKSLLKVSEI